MKSEKQIREMIRIFEMIKETSSNPVHEHIAINVLRDVLTGAPQAEEGEEMKPNYSDRIALCEHREGAICDPCFQKALNDAYAIGLEYGRLDENEKRGKAMTSPKLLTVDEIQEVKRWHGKHNQTFQVDKEHDTWVSLNNILDTALAAMRVVKLAERALDVFEELDDLQWEDGRPFNWDGITEDLSEALEPFQKTVQAKSALEGEKEGC